MLTMRPMQEHLARIQEKLTAWWEHADQKSPCLLVSLPVEGVAPPERTQDLRRHWFDVDYVMRHAMYGVEHTQYLGVSAPAHFPQLGSAAMAGVFGARMEYLDERTIWPHPSGKSLGELAEMALDPRNEFLSTMLEITRRSVSLSRGHHWVSPYAFEGPGDCLEGVYGATELFTAMVDQPGAVKAAIRNFTRLWIGAFDEVEQIIESAGNPGGIGWAGIWAPGRTFPLQEDFSYNLSPAMFREFLLPSLHEVVEAMPYPLFHLDGTTAHVPALLEIPGLRAIQWVPGPNREAIAPWYDLLRAIKAKGKSIEVFCTAAEVEDLVANVGARGLLIGPRDCTREEAERLLERYGD
jgi:hypothetical protein